jgi:hypothetical protein
MVKKTTVVTEVDRGGATETRAVVFQSPVVVRYGKKKRKKGSSQTARRLDDFERNLSKAARRISKGVKNGVDEYIDNRKRSERRRRDGAIVDFCENTSKGVARAISESSSVLTDFVRPWNSKRLRRQIRQTLRPIPMIF